MLATTLETIFCSCVIRENNVLKLLGDCGGAIVREGGAAKPITKHTPEIVPPRTLSREKPPFLLISDQYASFTPFQTKRLKNHNVWTADIYLPDINPQGEVLWV